MTKCNLCNSEDSNIILSIVKLKFLKCKICGLVYIDQEILNDSRGELKKEFSRINYKSYFSYYKDFRIKYFKKNLNLIQNLSNKGRILDIGCSFGWFLNEARLKGWETHGIEPSIFASNYARNNYNLNVITSNAEEINFHDDFFDAITLWNVIEHLMDPKKEIKILYKKLKEKGLLIICVPDINGLINKLSFLICKWSNCKISQPIRIVSQFEYSSPHLYYFSESTLIQLVEKQNFKHIKTVRQNMINVRKLEERFKISSENVLIQRILLYILLLPMKLFFLLIELLRKEEMVLYFRKI
jgi:2-polyprenyl-3-methyl-5-hydroxy-6-metoxy-1,4-benzoquinol methylase